MTRVVTVSSFSHAHHAHIILTVNRIRSVRPPSLPSVNIFPFVPCGWLCLEICHLYQHHHVSITHSCHPPSFNCCASSFGLGLCQSVAWTPSVLSFPNHYRHHNHNYDSYHWTTMLQIVLHPNTGIRLVHIQRCSLTLLY